jgi:hypothetical protein
MDPREGVDRWKARGKFETGFKEQIAQEVDSGLLWSPTGKPVALSGTPVGRNPEQKAPAKAGARVEGSVGAASRKYQISGSAIDRWRRQSRQGGLVLLAGSSILLAVRKSLERSEFFNHSGFEALPQIVIPNFLAHSLKEFFQAIFWKLIQGFA